MQRLPNQKNTESKHRVKSCFNSYRYMTIHFIESENKQRQIGVSSIVKSKITIN